MITLIDYGLGNILAFRNMYKRFNVDVRVAKTAEELRGATKIILPTELAGIAGAITGITETISVNGDAARG